MPAYGGHFPFGGFHIARFDNTAMEADTPQFVNQLYTPSSLVRHPIFLEQTPHPTSRNRPYPALKAVLLKVICGWEAKRQCQYL